MREWTDEIDLPSLQSIVLGNNTLEGDNGDRRKTIGNPPYNYRNTLTMRSEIEWVDEWIDLPSLTEFKGDDYNFGRIGSVILESMDLVFDWCRYPSIIIWWNQIQLSQLLLHLFPPILKYAFSHFLIIRCCCFGELHQFWKTGTNCIKYRYKKPNRIQFNSVGCGRSMDRSLWCFIYVRVITEQIPVTEDSSDWQ